MAYKSWFKLFDYDTIYSADSVEWCPIESHYAYLLCGTYFLLEKNEDSSIEEKLQKRIGSIVLLKVSNGKGLQKLYTAETNGILDIKWCQNVVGDDIIFAAVDAVGVLSLYKLFENKLGLVTSENLKSNETGDYMTLAVNWMKNREGSSVENICVSDNKGNGAIFLYINGCLQILNKWSAHSLEAWTIAFDPLSRDLVYTGGDDARLCLWDVRASTKDPQKVLKRQRTGVTIIQPDTGRDHLFLSGSFDECVLFWDNRQLKTPMYELCSSGGIWRLKVRSEHILTANIYGGFQIIKHFDEPQIVAEYKEHSSLAYGADWSYLSSNDISDITSSSDSSSYMIGTASFYDHLLTISVCDLRDQ